MFLILLGLVATITAFIIIGIDRNGDFKVKPKCFLAFIILVVIIGLSAFKTVPAGHTGVVTTFGKVENYTLEAGVHIINPLSQVTKIDNRTQKETIEMSAFSSDIQEVSVVYTVNYSIDKANAQNLYKTVGLEYYETVIQPKVIENVKKVMANYTAENLVSSRSEVASSIEKSLANDLANYNINLVATSIENLDFTDAFTDAVEAKQVAEQNKLKAQTESDTKVIEAQAAADVKLIEAEATAKANNLLNESISDSILQKIAIEKWNGELPTVLSDGSNILDLTGLNTVSE